MTKLIPATLALVLLLAPLFAATPEDTTAQQQAVSSFLCALTLVAGLAAIATRGKGSDPMPPGPRAARRANGAFGVLLGMASLSILARLGVQRDTAFLGPMLRALAILATDLALFWLAQRAARAGRAQTYALLLAAVTGAAIVAALGVQEYLTHWRAGDRTWRVFATSTPDYLAGYLVMLLPVTLALFLGAPPVNRAALLWGLVLAVQLAAMLLTGSRFALVSLALGVVVFLVALAVAGRHGFVAAPTTRRRLQVIAAVVVLAGLAAAGPVLHRLGRAGQQQQNSAAFRLWTWRGALHMAAANPVLGTGLGTWVDLYPPYARTGFTRLAHNSYLQMADECGVPALLALLATLALAGVAAARGLTAPSASEAVPSRGQGGAEESAWVASIAPSDDRLLLCGLLAGLAAGVAQNLIDSDWYVFFLGTTFWTLAGIAVGMSAGRTSSPPLPVRRGERPLLTAAGIGSAVLAIFAVTQGVAGTYSGEAEAEFLKPTAPDLATAEAALTQAHAWDPLNAQYLSDLGYKVYARQGGLPAAEQALRQAAAREPSGPVFYRLGLVREAEGRTPEALAALRTGLRWDPISLELLLELARLSPPPESLDVYRRIAALAETPVGTVPAIGDVSEVRWAIANAAVGDASAAVHQADEARRQYARAQRRLETYADEGGSGNPSFQVMHGGRPSPDQDHAMQALYQHVMDAQIGLAAPAEAEALRARAQDYGRKFDALFPKTP